MFLLALCIIEVTGKPLTGPTEMVPVQARRGNRKYIKYVPHPVRDVVNPHDLTNKVRPLDPHKPNDIRLVKEHHDATLRMAKKYGFTDLELSKLKTELRQQIIAYTKLTKNQKKFDQKRSEMRLVDAVKLDNAYKDQARQLHNTLYQLKSKALRKARKLEVEGWKVLEELASAEEFSKVDQDLLQDEIKKHVLDTKKFHHQHNEYQRKLANGLKSGKMEPEEYHRKQDLSRNKVTQHQARIEARSKGIEEKIRSRLSGEL